MESTGMMKKKSSRPSDMLAPGFRFHPTDEELVRYYLKRKICGKGFRFDAISEIDIYKSEPWDLPCKSKLKTRDVEWYFFSALDKKYGNGAKTNRATEKGYWKTTGKDRAVYGGQHIVGMKKTLVYHSGKAPKGQRTNWVMHEYRLANVELEKVQAEKEAFVLCRVYQKSGSGPKNGERYGAPFMEEEWEDEELESVPKGEVSGEVDFGDDAYLSGLDLDEILASGLPSANFPLPNNFQLADGSSSEGAAVSVNDNSNILVPAGQNYSETDQHLDTISDLSALLDTDIIPLNHENIAESNKSRNSEDLDFLLDDSFLDAIGELEGGFEPDNPAENDPASLDMLDEYLSFFDANDDNSSYFAYDPTLTMAVENTASDQSLLPQNEQATLPTGQYIDNNNKVAPLPSDKQNLANIYQSDYQLPFLKHASQMLGSIPAPPAFAAEFPSKDAILRSNFGALVPNEHKNLNIVVSFGFARGADGSASLQSSVSVFPWKTFSAFFRSGLYFMFLWILLFSSSRKLGAYLCAS